MNDLCDDNRFELIEKYKKELIDATNIETAPDEMAVLDDILFRFWQMGWLDSVDRMPLVKESARTLMHSVGDSISAKAFRNAGRFVQNAIDGEPPEFEKVPPAQPEREKGKWIRITQGAIPEQYICPFCHRTVETYGVEELLSIRYPYCHCGADMRGEQDE